MTTIGTLETKCPHSLAQIHLRAVRSLDRRILFGDNLQEPLTIHRLCQFARFRLTEAVADDVCNILLFQIVLVQLLDTGHLIVVKPIGRLLHPQLIEHLRIQLVVVNLTRIVDVFTLRNRHADVSA